MAIYGYCRISRKSQNILRQERNILSAFPTAKIYKEAFTGTKLTGRMQFAQLLARVQAGDSIVFDSVSRMSRNAEDGVKLYFELYDKGIQLVFLKEPYINTNVYKTALHQTIPKTGNNIADIYITATNTVIRLIAKEQIYKAFEQAQKEIDDLHIRTAEGIETARLKGKQIGQKKGVTFVTKKSVEKKAIIRKHSRDFGGTLSDSECLKLTGLSRNTFYKYKRELRDSLSNHLIS